MPWRDENKSISTFYSQQNVQGIQKQNVFLFLKILARVFTMLMHSNIHPTSLGHPSTTNTSRENPSDVEKAWASWIFSPISPSIKVNWNA